MRIEGNTGEKQKKTTCAEAVCSFLCAKMAILGLARGKEGNFSRKTKIFLAEIWWLFGMFVLLKPKERRAGDVQGSEESKNIEIYGLWPEGKRVLTVPRKSDFFYFI